MTDIEITDIREHMAEIRAEHKKLIALTARIAPSITIAGYALGSAPTSVDIEEQMSDTALLDD